MKFPDAMHECNMIGLIAMQNELREEADNEDLKDVERKIRNTAQEETT